MTGRGNGDGLRSLAIKTLLISPSGALSPGPLSISAIALGARLGLAGGLAVALGHMLFELPYVALLTKGFERVESIVRRYEKYLIVSVVVFLVYFSAMLLRDALDILRSFQVGGIQGLTAANMFEAVLTGIILTGGNAYFLLWWVTVALPIVRETARHGTTGFAVMYGAHVWMDYLWLGLLAASGGVARILGVIPYAALLIILAGLLLLFAADMMLRTFTSKRVLPF
ncbi:Lysine exporter protein (LYSE/YGGA) [Pyrolobus fumarii 1A]|uniref:Lysine exporter protein (LYSE/YGGA) n=1 Tax=Pyrolobus fumarii (strain DSM 11204 / 1A) TaxID=694429 RepID=G0EHR1_PYRF1|nr:LysE family transporter [Pyrolobus fumarii]AEM39414.1 Lysine exporter protein (LYSE/YGGA) [Pyrolobus fumarii 1A]